jgi:plasmid stabilization system protein ParE
MGLTVRFAPRALSDLEQVREYLVELSPTGAERVRVHLVETINRLTDFPFLGRATDAPGVRVLALARYPYLIFYSVIMEYVVILHVRHGAREPIDPSTL